MPDYPFIKPSTPPKKLIIPATWRIDPTNHFVNGAAYSANDDHYIPFEVDQDVTASGFELVVVTQAGNIDIGIYMETAGVKLGSSGSVLVAVAGVQVVPFTANIRLPRGRYRLGYGVSSAAAVFSEDRLFHGNTANALIIGNVKKNNPGTFPLPAAATMIAPTRVTVLSGHLVLV